MHLIFAKILEAVGWVENETQPFANRSSVGFPNVNPTYDFLFHHIDNQRADDNACGVCARQMVFSLHPTPYTLTPDSMFQKVF